MILIESCVFVWFYFSCFAYPEYSWSIKYFLYIIYPIGIIGSFYYMNNMKLLPKSFTRNIHFKLYQFINYFFDIVELIIFTIVDFKVLFVLCIIAILLNISIKLKYLEIENHD